MKWFKHDSDANRDPKLEKVLMRYGAEGYALYWLCIELIAAPIDRRNINFDLEHDAEVLAYRLKMDSAKVEEIMKFMVHLNLFEIDPTTQRITCLKLASRLENSIIKNPQLKEIQQSILNDPGQSRTSSDNLGKVRLDVDTDIDIDKTCLNASAWRDYEKHRKEIRAPRLTDRGKQMAQSKLCKLSHDEQQACVDLSISNGWRGLFPNKEGLDGKNRRNTESFGDIHARVRKAAGLD